MACKSWALLSPVFLVPFLLLFFLLCRVTIHKMDVQLFLCYDSFLSLSASRCWTHQCDTFSSMSNLNGKQETRKRDRYNFWWKIAVDAIFLRNVRLMRNGSYSVQSSKNKWFNGKIVLTEKMIFLWDIFTADFTSWSSFVVFFFFMLE